MKKTSSDKSFISDELTFISTIQDSNHPIKHFKLQIYSFENIVVKIYKKILFEETKIYMCKVHLIYIKTNTYLIFWHISQTYLSEL